MYHATSTTAPTTQSTPVGSGGRTCQVVVCVVGRTGHDQRVSAPCACVCGAASLESACMLKQQRESKLCACSSTHARQITQQNHPEASQINSHSHIPSSQGHLAWHTACLDTRRRSFVGGLSHLPCRRGRLKGRCQVTAKGCICKHPLASLPLPSVLRHTFRG
jgi:hypothetical protein